MTEIQYVALRTFAQHGRGTKVGPVLTNPITINLFHLARASSAQCGMLCSGIPTYTPTPSWMGAASSEWT